MALGLAGLAAAAAVGPQLIGSNASGTGAIRFGDEGGNVAMFDFTLVDNPQPGGEFLCAAEAHNGLFPDVIIRLEEIISLEIGARDVLMVGEATLHEDRVIVHVYAWDGEGTAQKDWFSIKTFSAEQDDDHHDFEAEGELHSGDVRIARAR